MSAICNNCGALVHFPSKERAIYALWDHVFDQHNGQDEGIEFVDSTWLLAVTGLAELIA